MSRYQDTRDSIDSLRKDLDYGFYVRQWIDYEEVHQNRIKLLHDIRLRDGRECIGYYPNGDSWSKFTQDTEGPQLVYDNDVTHIRISEKQMGEW